MKILFRLIKNIPQTIVLLAIEKRRQFKVACERLVEFAEIFSVPIVKHLRDRDDLLEGRDAGLVAGQEESAQKIADEIYANTVGNGARVLVFAVSPKKRAMETASLVKDLIRVKSESIKVVSVVDDSLREIDQGKFILPQGYRPGDIFIGLQLAGRIFSEEVFNRQNLGRDNLLYRYGDPVLLPDGEYKYPELIPYFSSPGESYRDVLLRFYGQIVLLSEQIQRYNDQIRLVVFTHGQPHQIFNDLSLVADQVYDEGIMFEPGKLPRLCWDVYQARRKGVVSFGKVDFVSASRIFEPKIVSLLRREIEYLRKLGHENNLSFQEDEVAG